MFNMYIGTPIGGAPSPIEAVGYTIIYPDFGIIKSCQQEI